MRRATDCEDDVPLLELEQNGLALGGRITDEEVFTQPPEPAVKLELLRESQLRAMVAQGKGEAEASRVQSGFFGGAAPLLIAAWVAGSIAGLVRARSQLLNSIVASTTRSSLM